MSTGLECEFIEVRAGEWYYLLEHGSSPKLGDWMDHCSAYGKFSTFDEANLHLRRNHANPGGYSTYFYDPADLPASERLADLIAEATR